MLSGPRSIFFHTELQIPPIEDLRIGPEQVVSLYNRMRESSGYPYQNIDLQAEIPKLSTRRPGGGESSCSLGGNRLVIEERHPEVNIDPFLETVHTILGGLDDGFPPFVVQRVRIECLAQPHACENSIELLASKVANVYEAIGPFRRPPSFFGVRFRFPPLHMFADDDEGDEESEGDHEDVAADPPNEAIPAADQSVESDSDDAGPQGNEEGEAAEPHSVCDDAMVSLRFETYARDPLQVWMEVAAQYLGPWSAHDADEISVNIRETYRFLTQRGIHFLNQFDVTGEG